jgi:hypothetical protein
MLRTKKDDPAELLRLAIVSLDAQITELRKRRAQLAALTSRAPAGPAVAAATPTTRKRSVGTKPKLSASAKALWSKERKEKAEKKKSNAAARTTPAKAKPAEPAPARTRSEKSIPDKVELTKNNSAKKTLAPQGKQVDVPKTITLDVSTPAGIVERLAQAGARFSITRGGSLIIGNLGSLPPDVQRLFLDHPNPHLLTAAARQYLVSGTRASEK